MYVSQVCAHIVAAISAEAQCFRDEWELSLCSDQPVTLTSEDGGPRLTDSYCYEMLSMVMALLMLGILMTYTTILRPLVTSPRTRQA